MIARARRRLFVPLLLSAASSFGCVQRAILLPLSKPSPSPAPISSAAVLPPAAEPRSKTQDHGRFIVRAADSKLEVTGGDLITGSHVMKFRRWRGVLLLDESQPTTGISARLTIDIDLTTLKSDADVEGFLKHYLLEVHKFPRARITIALRPREGGGDEHVAQGRVWLHGVERVIRFHADVRKDGDDWRLESTFDMSRGEFDIRRPDALDFIIHDDFRIVLDLTAHAEHVFVVEVAPLDLAPR